jgi:hypothetical protein
MRALDWQRFLQQQRDEHRKVVFTTTELANVAHASPGALNVTLRRLIEQRVLVRYATGRYGLPGTVRPEDLVPTLDTSAYVTGMYSLYKHLIITQAPTEITCFTNRRHNRSRVRKTPFGRIVFMCVESSVYSTPRDGVMASREQAFCDFLHVCRKRGVRASNLVTFRNMDRLDRQGLAEVLTRYPVAARREATRLLAENGLMLPD